MKKQILGFRTNEKIHYNTLGKILSILFIVSLFSNVLMAQTRFKSLNYLYSISGSKCVSGQHNDQKDGTGTATYTDRVFNITGKYPALWSGDFLFHGDHQMRLDVVAEAERQWKKGAIINIMWHCCPPDEGATCGWDPGVIGSLTYTQWTSLLTDGGSMNQIWKSRMDEIAQYLQMLEDKGVEVFFRPLHEQNQPVFWWNGKTEDGVVHPDYTKRLFQLTHDYFNNTKGLSNLIWIWDVQDMSGNYADYNPGSNYFELAAVDIYGDGYSNSSYYNSLVIQAGGKPIAIGECFGLPNATVLQNYPKYTFFMEWAYGLQQNNTDQAIRDVYNNTRVITLDEMPGWNNPVPDNLAKGKTVTVSSTEAGANLASNAVDGNYATRWSSLYADPQWITIDLGASYSVNRVKISWETALGKDFLVQISTNNSTWSTLKTVSGNTSTTTDYTGLSGTGRYVRIYGTARATTYGYSIYELEVYGTSSTVPVTGVSVSPVSAKINIGGTQQLTPTVSPSNASNKNVSYTSSDPSVASVNSSGLVTGIKAGNTTITVTTVDQAKTATSSITVASSGTNIAKNKPVTVSSTEASTLAASYAVDGSTTTRWASLYSDPQWIYVDLQATYNITKVVLNWEAAYGKSYQVQVSSDATNWTNMYTTTTGSGGINTLTVSGTGRYVRVYGTVRGTAYGYSLWELEVYGTVVTTAANVALNKPVTVTSTEAGNNLASNGVDGNGSTRWSSTYADGQNYIIDLGAIYNISRFVIKWEAAYARSFQIQVSNDNINWTNAYVNYAFTGGTTDATVTTSGRYVKMYGITRATAFGFSFWEFEVYGVSALKSATTNTSSNIAPTIKTINSKIQVFPNPVSDKLKINLGENDNGMLNIYKLDGRLIYKEKLKNNNNEVDIQTLKGSGVVVVRVSAGSEISTLKVIIK